jgi:hypothetical protein
MNQLILEEYENLYWPQLRSALDTVLLKEPGTYQPISYEQVWLPLFNGTAQNNCLNTNIYSYLETSGGQSYNLYSNVIHFFNTSVN